MGKAESKEIPVGTKILMWAMGLYITIMSPIQIWCVTQIFDLNGELKSISGNRFTSQDGLDVWKEIGEIRTEIAAIPKEVPPPWFKKEVETLEEKVDDLTDLMVQHLQADHP